MEVFTLTFDENNYKNTLEKGKGDEKNALVFYTIKSDTRPIPYGTNLIYFKLNNDKSIDDIIYAYDPFNHVKDMLYMITWTVPVPYSTPLYAYLHDNDVYLSLKKLSLPVHNDLPTLYVLTNPNDNLQTIYGKNEFAVKNGVPEFRFSRDFGRCIPDVKSNLTIDECLKDYNVTFDDTTLLGYIRDKHYGRKEAMILVGVIVASVIGWKLIFRK